jgi:glyoxylase-like metal-dependent hydrolase (beta-lactamase superfamily II)
MHLPAAVPPRLADIAAGTVVIDLDYLGREEAIAACLLETDAGLVIIDPGPATTLPALHAALAERGATVADVAAILLTHIHLDHAGAAGSLLRENPAIAVHVHERGAPHLVDPTKLLDSATRIYGDRMQALWGEFLPVPAAAVHTLAGGETLALGGRTIDVAYTPGHAWHHVSYLDRASGSAFVGDTAGERYPSGTPAIPATPPPDIELERWAESTQQFRIWSPDRLVVTHFGAIDDVTTHLDEHERALAEWSTRVRESLAKPGADDAHADEFTTRVMDELRQSVSPRALERVKPASVRSGWFGLARYWRKRGN